MPVAQKCSNDDASIRRTGHRIMQAIARCLAQESLFREGQKLRMQDQAIRSAVLRGQASTTDQDDPRQLSFGR